VVVLVPLVPALQAAVALDRAARPPHLLPAVPVLRDRVQVQAHLHLVVVLGRPDRLLPAPVAAVQASRPVVSTLVPAGRKPELTAKQDMRLHRSPRKVTPLPMDGASTLTPTILALRRFVPEYMTMTLT
jgi:hypothetical protein